MMIHALFSHFSVINFRIGRLVFLYLTFCFRLNIRGTLLLDHLMGQNPLDGSPYPYPNPIPCLVHHGVQSHHQVSKNTLFCLDLPSDLCDGLTQVFV